MGDLVDPTKNPCLVAHLLLVISEVACRGLAAGRLSDHLPLGHLCGCVWEVLEGIVRDRGLVSVLHTHFHLFSLLAHVISARATTRSSDYIICGPGNMYVCLCVKKLENFASLIFTKKWQTLNVGVLWLVFDYQVFPVIGEVPFHVTAL